MKDEQKTKQQLLVELAELRRRLAELESSAQRGKLDGGFFEGEDRFRLLAENVQDMICHYRLVPEPGFEYVSPGSTTMIGYTPEEHYADPNMPLRIVHPEDRPLLEARFSALSTNTEPLFIRLIHKDGTVVWTEHRNAFTHDQNGTCVAIQAIIRDVTKNKNLESVLQKHRNHLKELVEARTNELVSANHILQWEIAERQRVEEWLAVERKRLFSLLDSLPAFLYLQAPDYSIRFANRRFMEIFGDPGTKPCYKVLHDRTEPCPVCKTFSAFATECPESWEWTRSDGRTYQIYNYPFSDIDGSPLVVVMGIDITELKQLKKEMARLERLNLVGEMAASIGHEIRNPMTTVRGFSQLLSRKTECLQYKEYFDLMIGELDRANSIITEFISLAKNKAVDLQMQSLNAIVEAIFPLITADAMMFDKFVEKDLQELPDLLLDEKEIRQIILNLVRNGLEAMPPGGLLSIRTYTEDNEVILAVGDQGKGMAPEVLEKIGTPFFTTKEQGTGLGLAVCYSIAARHHAKIKLETGPAGTTFFVRFKT